MYAKLDKQNDFHDVILGHRMKTDETAANVSFGGDEVDIEGTVEIEDVQFGNSSDWTLKATIEKNEGLAIECPVGKLSITGGKLKYVLGTTTIDLGTANAGSQSVMVSMRRTLDPTDNSVVVVEVTAAVKDSQRVKVDTAQITSAVAGDASVIKLSSGVFKDLLFYGGSFMDYERASYCWRLPQMSSVTSNGNVVPFYL